MIFNHGNKMSRKVTEAIKKRIAGKQAFKCANRPNINLKGLEGYECNLWKLNDENKGSFDESGYEIDHINEHCKTGDDSEENLQALCKSCHLVKTKRFLSNYKFTLKQIIKTKSEDKNIKAFLEKLTSKQIQYVCRLVEVNYGGSMQKMIDRILSYNIISLKELKKQIDEISNKKYVYWCGHGYLIHSNEDIKSKNNNKLVNMYCDDCKETHFLSKFNNPFYDNEIGEDDEIREDDEIEENNEEEISDIETFLNQFNVKQLKQLQWMLGITDSTKSGYNKNKESLINNVQKHKITVKKIKVKKIKELINECVGKKYMYRCYGTIFKGYHILYKSNKIPLDKKNRGKCNKCGDNSMMCEFINEFANIEINDNVVDI